MKFKKIALSIVLASSIITGCGVLPKEEGDLTVPIIMPAEVTYKTVEVALRELIKDVTATGYIVPAITQNLSYSEKGGRIKAIHVLRGAEVKKGDVLIELIVDQLPETIVLQKLTIAQMKEEQTFTKEIQALELERDQQGIESLEGKIKQMAAYPSLYTSEDVTSIKEQLTLAQLNLSILKLNHHKTLTQKENVLVIEAKKLTTYEADLEAASIKAPMDGVITFVKKMNLGDVILDFDTLMTIADSDKMQIEYQGIQASDFELGMVATLEHKKQTYTGIVVQTPKSVPEEEKEDYQDVVIVDFDAMPEAFREGDEVKIQCVIEANPSAIVVPKGAVKTYGSDSILYVLADGRKEERYVKTGLDNGYEIEILDGLEVGEQIITN
jgi:macrolide-specific efflux system membrane fusion protein